MADPWDPPHTTASRGRGPTHMQAQVGARATGYFSPTCSLLSSFFLKFFGHIPNFLLYIILCFTSSLPVNFERIFNWKYLYLHGRILRVYFGVIIKKIYLIFKI